MHIVCSNVIKSMARGSVQSKSSIEIGLSGCGSSSSTQSIGGLISSQLKAVSKFIMKSLVKKPI